MFWEDNAMDKQANYFLVEASVLPETFHKVVAAKKLLSSGKCKTVNEAVRMLQISRSAYYKYKDFVFPFYEKSKEKIITLSFIVEDEPGVLSSMLNSLADFGANVLTINQNIPTNGIANITISIETGKLRGELEIMMKRLSEIKGVNKTDILASE